MNTSQYVLWILRASLLLFLFWSFLLGMNEWWTLVNKQRPHLFRKQGQTRAAYKNKATLLFLYSFLDKFSQKGTYILFLQCFTMFLSKYFSVKHGYLAVYSFTILKFLWGKWRVVKYLLLCLRGEWAKLNWAVLRSTSAKKRTIWGKREKCYRVFHEARDGSRKKCVNCCKYSYIIRQVSSMIHSAKPTASPVVNIVFTWNLFCFEKCGRHVR